MESLVSYLINLDPWAVYAVVGGIAFIENVFPPFPSDVFVVAAGSLVGLGHVDPIILVLVTTTGSTAGFMTMYGIGHWVGAHVLETGRIRFLPPEQVRTVEMWFQRYGYGVVVANRFLAGTRAVVSFFAGMSRLPILLCVGLSFVSAAVWNLLLVEAGHALGSNWEQIILYLDAYGKTVTSIVVVAALGYLAFRVFGQRSRKNKKDPEPRP
jgi:membrane protein DedA with SNARE-associated domain